MPISPFMPMPIGPMFIGPIPGISIIGFIPTLGPIMPWLAVFIMALAPVTTIVRSSGGKAISWSSGIAAKF
jgi:hypothetical protein